MRKSRCLLAVVAPVLALLSCGRNTPLDQAEREYAPPAKATNYGQVTLAPYVKGNSSDKEMVLDLDKLYRSSHRMGWENAFAHWRYNQKFEPRELRVIDAPAAGNDGYQDGYQAAVEKIERLPEESPPTHP